MSLPIRLTPMWFTWGLHGVYIVASHPHVPSSETYGWSGMGHTHEGHRTICRGSTRVYNPHRVYYL